MNLTLPNPLHLEKNPLSTSRLLLIEQIKRRIKKTLKKKSLNDLDQDRIHGDVDVDRVIVEEPLEVLHRDEGSLRHRYRKKSV